MLISRVLILLSLLLTFSDASNPEPEHCTTKYGSYSAQYVPHSTLTSIRTCWDTVTKTVGQGTHIVTPKPTTKYVTSTEIVKATKSGSVKTVKTTYTSYSTLTQTSSTTVPVPTVTVTPTLIPASDSLSFIRGRAVSEANVDQHRKLAKRDPGYVRQYPTAVVCTIGAEKRKTKTVTHTAPVHTTTLKPDVQTSIRRVTRTITSIEHPVTTLTATTSGVITSTVFQTSTIGAETTTSYSTISGPTPTACGPENLFKGSDPDANGLINGIVGVFDAGTQQPDETPEQCCLSCVTKQDCGLSYFVPTDSVGQQCYHVISSNCNAQSGQYGLNDAIWGQDEIDPAVGWTVSNGYCGTWVGGGR